MAYQALYRKYRPHSFDDFIDQDNVKKILVNSIKNNKISHAYLFSGPRGIGKTSMAKIFAKAINCLNFDSKNDVCDICDNCKECDEQSVDIIEIDAASNNGVDQIRDLKNKIYVVPSKLKYKVYIIDEVHMLTNSAFNALLKTLEEPPAHVVFILATTEFYEVPETIVSRCQCFNFTRITLESLQKRLKYISEKEKINITDDAITEIAHYSNGGLRDAIGMLDKLNSFTDEKITIDVFKSINGMISQSDIELFYTELLQKNLAKVIEIINKVENQGYDFKNFIERIMMLVRDKIVNYYINSSDIVGDITDNIELITVLNDILNKLKDAVNPLVIVQIYILKYIENVSFISREIKNEEAKMESKIISQEIKNTIVSEKNISQEIKNNSQNTNELTYEVDDSKKIDSSNEKDKVEKTCKNDQISGKIHVNLQNKSIRINNSMATANISYKKELSEIWKKLNKYFMDSKYSKVAQLLSDTVPMVVGVDYAILTTISDGIIDNIYNNLVTVEDFINMIYHQLKIVVITDSEFENVKKKYIEDRKKNIIYQVQEECGKLIEEGDNLINKAINVFGSDIVEIE